MRRTKKSLLALVLTALVTVTGCQAIPQESGVHAGLDDFAQAQEQVVYRPDMPVPDANQEDIVRGFLQAASSSADDYHIARQFLTTNYQNVWNPYMSVLIDEGSRKYVQTSPGQTKVTLTALTTVDENGVMDQLTPDNDTEIPFELRRENGQWRIDAAPNGVILDKTTFKDVWSPQQLNFMSGTGTLDGDTRWFLNRGSITTQLIDQLLEGPQPALHGALFSAFPHGTALTTDAVIIEAGIAHIDVTSDILNATDEQLQQIQDQIATTLNPVPGVTEFRVTVNKAEIISGQVTPEVGTQNSAQNNSQNPPQENTGWPAVIKEGEFGFVTPSGFEPNSELNETVKTLNASKIIFDETNNSVITQNSSGVLYADESGVSVLIEDTNQLEPSLDKYGYVWTLNGSNPEKLTVTLPGVSQTELSIPWLEGSSLHSFKVSPNGNRVAFIVKENNSYRVIITGVVRATNNLPNYLNDPEGRWVFWLKDTPLDLDWVDSQRVAVLERTTQGNYRITTGGLGLFAEERPAVQNATVLHGSTRLGQMTLLDTEGDLWTPQGTTGWQKQTSAVELLAKRN